MYSKLLSSLFTLILRIQSMLGLYALHQAKMEKAICLYEATRKNKKLQKLKAQRARRLNRKRKITWSVEGKSEIFWTNLFNDASPSFFLGLS